MRHPAAANPETHMKRYLLGIYQPDGAPPPSVKPEKIMRDVGVVRDELKPAGAWVFSDGLHPASTATVIRMKEGEALLTDGPFVEGKEHLGGLCIIDAPDLDAALTWGCKQCSLRLDSRGSGLGGSRVRNGQRPRRDTGCVAQLSTCAILS